MFPSELTFRRLPWQSNHGGPRLCAPLSRHIATRRSLKGLSARYVRAYGVRGYAYMLVLSFAGAQYGEGAKRGLQGGLSAMADSERRGIPYSPGSVTRGPGRMKAEGHCQWGPYNFSSLHERSDRNKVTLPPFYWM